MKRPAFFFDRDGVVNVAPDPRPYVLSPAEFHLSDGIIEALAWLKARGFVLILATSQQCVGKGLISQIELNAIHEHMQGLLRPHSAEFDGIYACTCLGSEANCTCRKPSPEMLLRAAEDHDLDLANSWLAGDADRDIGMAQNAGVTKTIRVLTHPGKEPSVFPASYTVGSVAEMGRLIREVIG